MKEGKNMNLITENLKKVDMFNEILEQIKNGDKGFSFKNIIDIQKAYYVYSLTSIGEKSSVVICSNVLTANKMMQDLKFLSEFEIVFFPAKSVVYYDIEAQSRENQNDRMYAMSKIKDNSKKIVVTTIDALMLPMISNDIKIKENILLKKDDIKNFSELEKGLVNLRI